MSNLPNILDNPFDVHKLPATPEIFLELQALLDENMPPIKKIIRTILSDPALTLRVLSLVTLTGHFDPLNSTITIAKVINFIGLNPIRELLENQNIFHDELALKNETLFDIHEYWKHSLFAAFAAERMATEMRYQNPEEAYTAALIHDIGKLAIARFSPEKSYRINKMYRSHSNYFKAEEKILRTKHPEIGAEIAEELRLPVSMSSAIFRHHDDHTLLRYKNREKSLELIVFVSNSISKIFCHREHANHYFYEGQENANMFLDFSHTQYRRVVRQVGDKIYKLIDDLHSRSEGLRHYCITLENSCKTVNAQTTKLKEAHNLLHLKEMELKIMEELLPKLTHGKDIEGLILALAQSVSTYVNMKYTAVFLFEKRTNSLINKVHFGLPPDDPMRWATFDLNGSKGTIMTTFKDGKSYNIKSYTESLGENCYSMEEARYVKNFPFATIPILKWKTSIAVLYVSHAMIGQEISKEEFEIFNKFCRYVNKAIS
ncbi:MAG: HDOD domain-containing protein [Calditrichaeota bacterium]|nr:MAG: HDOD domain-containing protein [Calditrichota bacterium]